MPTNLTVVLKDEPGQLATLGGATGAAGVNIEGMCAFTGEGRGIINLLIADEAVERAVAALEQAGMGVADRREVLVVDVADRPGSLGELTTALENWNKTWTATARPFKWTKTADQIIDRICRYCSRISGPGH